MHLSTDTSINKLSCEIKKELEYVAKIIKGELNGKNSDEKEAIRRIYYNRARQTYSSFLKYFEKKMDYLLTFFANGTDVIPEKISPRVEIVNAQNVSSEIFRFASLLWSIPVTPGYGRRIRFLVWDDNNDKLIGIIGLADPVFNLNPRDEFFQWSSKDREKLIKYIMNAYVLGAVPPYNSLLGGKLIACLIRSNDVAEIFRTKYQGSVGIISKEEDSPHLVAVTTTSALGRSSIYNRLKLGNITYFKSVGYTKGYGHFHISDELFGKMREYLSLIGHNYHNGHSFGNGPNWKMRTIRACLKSLNVDSEIARHGVRREVFISSLANNALAFLQGKDHLIKFDNLLSIDQISKLAIERWLLPRSIRRPEYREWKNAKLPELIVK